MANSEGSLPKKPRGRPRRANTEQNEDSLILDQADFEVSSVPSTLEQTAPRSWNELSQAADRRPTAPLLSKPNEAVPERKDGEMAVRTGRLLKSPVPQLCPRCLQTVGGFVEQVRSNDVDYVCPKCTEFIPFRYVRNYQGVSRVRLSLAGMSGHGKTMFLRGVYSQLTSLGRKWSGFHFAPLSDDDARAFKAVIDENGRGELANPSQLTERPVGFELNGVPGAGNLHLLLYDISGEAFETSESLRRHAFFIPGSKVITFILSLSDIESGTDLAFLLSRLVDAIRATGEDPRSKSLVVVLTKGDLLRGDQNLPASAETFLENEAKADPRDLHDLECLSAELEEWLRNHPDNYWNFVEAAKSEFENVRYTVISSIGSNPGTSGAQMQLSPRNVLSPLLWLFRFTLPTIRLQLNEQERVFFDLNDAFEAAAASGQKMTSMAFEPGDYCLRRPPEIRSGIQLVGAGEQDTRIVIRSEKAHLQVTGGQFSATNLSFISEGTEPSLCLNLVDSEFNIRNCVFSGARRSAGGESLGNGLQIDGHSSGQIERCNFNDNGGHGLLIKGVAKVSVSDCSSHMNQLSGLQFSGRCEVQVRGNHSYRNQNGITAAADAQVELTDNDCGNNRSAGIAIEDRASATLGMNKCEGNVKSLYVAETASQTTLRRSSDVQKNQPHEFENSSSQATAIGTGIAVTVIMVAILVAVMTDTFKENPQTSSIENSPLASVETPEETSMPMRQSDPGDLDGGTDHESKESLSTPPTVNPLSTPVLPKPDSRPSPETMRSEVPVQPEIPVARRIEEPKPALSSDLLPQTPPDSKTKTTPNRPAPESPVQPKIPVAESIDEPKPVPKSPAEPKIANTEKPDEKNSGGLPPNAASPPSSSDSGLTTALQNQGKLPIKDKAVERAKGQFNGPPDLAARTRSDRKNDEATRLMSEKKYRDAERIYEEAVELDITNPRPKMNLARLLASCPDSAIRDGKRAVDLAIAGCSQKDDPGWQYLGILAAAYAEVGNFDEAIQWGRKAKQKAAGADAGKMDVNLRLFEKRQPCLWDTDL